MSSTNFWPNPVEPRGLGAATTQPCAAQSDGFQRYDHASSHAPCGPPWIRKTTGYFFDASKFGGLISQYWTGVPPAPAAVRLSGFANVTSFSQDSFSCVSACGVSTVARVMRKISPGAVSVDLRTTAKSAPNSNALMEPPLVSCTGGPDGPPLSSGARKRLSSPLFVAMKTTLVPS